MDDAADRCVYPVYVALYQEIVAQRSRGLAIDEKMRRAAQWLCEDITIVAQLAIEDASKGLPMRSKVHVCRMETEGECCRCSRGT